MDAFENAKKFFEACEAPEGWAGCKQYVVEGAPFSAQCEPLEGVDTVQEQIRICRLKAGIGPEEPIELQRFEVARYT